MKITINKTFDIDYKTLKFMQRLYEEDIAFIENQLKNIKDRLKKVKEETAMYDTKKIYKDDNNELFCFVLMDCELFFYCISTGTKVGYGILLGEKVSYITKQEFEYILSYEYSPYKLSDFKPLNFIK